MKKKMWKKSLLSLSIALALSGTAWAMPSGGTVVPGGEVAGGLPGGVIADGTTINVTKPSVIEWNSFNIESSETLNFAGQALLNRVTGGDPSAILGRLHITNNAWALVNPNGIVVGPGAVINASHLALSTLELSNEDFMNRGRGGHWEMDFTTPTGREIPAEVKIQGANITVGADGIQVYGGTGQLLDGVSITRNLAASVSPSDIKSFAFRAANQWQEKWDDDQSYVKANDANILKMDRATIESKANGSDKSGMRFFGGQVKGKDSDVKEMAVTPGMNKGEVHFKAEQCEGVASATTGGAPINLEHVNISADKEIQFHSGKAALTNCEFKADDITFLTVDGVNFQGDLYQVTGSADNTFRMAGGKLQANGRMAILAGKVDFSDSAELIAKKTLAVVSVKKALIGGGSTFMMPAMEAGKDNTLHLGNTEITRHDGSHAFLAGGNVYLDSAQMDDKASVTVAVGERITPPQTAGSGAATASVREKLYTIDKGTSQFPDHTVYLEPELQVTPPIVGPTDITPPNSPSAAINAGWAVMNEVLKDDAAPEKAAELVKTLNEATKGARTDESVATVIGYAKAIEGSGLSTAEKITMFRTVLDTYQPTVEESTAADAATQAEIDKKDPSPALIFTAQEAFLSGTGEATDLREPVTGL